MLRERSCGFAGDTPLVCSPAEEAGDGPQCGEQEVTRAPDPILFQLPHDVRHGQGGDSPAHESEDESGVDGAGVCGLRAAGALRVSGGSVAAPGQW